MKRVTVTMELAVPDYLTAEELYEACLEIPGLRFLLPIVIEEKGRLTQDEIIDLG